MLTLPTENIAKPLLSGFVPPLLGIIHYFERHGGYVQSSVVKAVAALRWGSLRTEGMSRKRLLRVACRAELL